MYQGIDNKEYTISMFLNLSISDLKFEIQIATHFHSFLQSHILIDIFISFLIKCKVTFWVTFLILEKILSKLKFTAYDISWETLMKLTSKKDSNYNFYISSVLVKIQEEKTM